MTGNTALPLPETLPLQKRLEQLEGQIEELKEGMLQLYLEFLFQQKHLGSLRRRARQEMSSRPASVTRA